MGLERGLHGLVAQPCLLVRADALDLGLDIRHAGSLIVCSGSECTTAKSAGATTQSTQTAGSASNQARRDSENVGLLAERGTMVEPPTRLERSACRYNAPIRRRSATSASSPTSITASRRWPTACCNSRAWSTSARCAPNT